MTPREAELTAALAASQQENAQLRQEVELLNRKIDALVRRIFGAKSEQLNPAQLELLLTGSEAPAAPPPGADRRETDCPQDSPEGEHRESKDEASRVASTAADTLEAAPANHAIRRPKPARRPRLPEHLPVIEEIIDPEPVKADPQAWRCIGQEVTEQLDYTPGKFWRRHLIRRKYVRKHQPEAPPVIAPLHTLQDGCLAAPGLLAAIIVGSRPQGDSQPPGCPAGVSGSEANTATTFRFTGRSKSSKRAIKSTCRARPWPAGWPWPPTG